MIENIVNTSSEHETCPAVGHQMVSVCVPVTVTPFARPGMIVTRCCGNPVITPGHKSCSGIKNGSCTFTISQDIRVEVPVEFGAAADVGDPFVSCDDMPAEDVFRGCDLQEETDVLRHP